MPNDSDTCGDVKTMHPRCITAPLGRVAYDAWWAADVRHASLASWDREDAETREQWEASARAVMRLRGSNAQIDSSRVDAALQRAESPSGAIAEGDAALLADEVRRLREASAVTAVNFGKAQLEIAQLQTEVSRLRELIAAREEALRDGLS